jgi:hypothetical protein
MGRDPKRRASRAADRRLAAAGAEASDPTGWTEVETLLRSAPIVGPTPGFSWRWRQRLAEAPARQANRQTWWSLGLAMGGALAALALWMLLGPVTSPADLTAAAALRAIAWGRGLEIIVGILEDVVGGIPFLLRALAGLGVWFAVGWLSAVWLASFYRLAFQEVRNGGNHA